MTSGSDVRAPYGPRSLARQRRRIRRGVSSSGMGSLPLTQRGRSVSALPAGALGGSWGRQRSVEVRASVAEEAPGGAVAGEEIQIDGRDDHALVVAAELGDE